MAGLVHVGGSGGGGAVGVQLSFKPVVAARKGLRMEV